MHKRYKALKALGNTSFELGGKHNEYHRKRYHKDTGEVDIPLISRFNVDLLESKKEALLEEIADITEFLVDIYEAIEEQEE